MEAKTTRKLRRYALLSGPCNNPTNETVATIAKEGYDGLMLWPSTETRQFIGACFTPEQGRRVAGMAHEHGLRVIAFTCYIKYHEPLIQVEPHRALIAHGKGPQVDCDDLPARWMCPFRPENREYYLELLRDIATWPGIREIQLNDEASLAVGGPVGCYCEYCTAEFEKLTGSKPPVKDVCEPDNPLWWKWTEFRMQNWLKVHSE